MVREIMRDEAFLSQKAEPATLNDLPVAQNLLDTLTDHKDGYAFTQQIVAESRNSDAWYPCFDRFSELLRHKNSLVRNRAIAILAANARWDREGEFNALLDEFLSHVTDVKPITARQCVAALQKMKEQAYAHHHRPGEENGGGYGQLCRG